MHFHHIVYFQSNTAWPYGLFYFCAKAPVGKFVFTQRAPVKNGKNLYQIASGFHSSNIMVGYFLWYVSHTHTTRTHTHTRAQHICACKAYYFQSFGRANSKEAWGTARAKLRSSYHRSERLYRHLSINLSHTHTQHIICTCKACYFPSWKRAVHPTPLFAHKTPSSFGTRVNLRLLKVNSRPHT